MRPTCPVVRLGDLDATQGRLEENAAFHMRCQRQLLVVRWSDFVTNVTISESTGHSDIGGIIAGRRHSLFVHIRRLPADVPAHMALKLSVVVCSGTKPSLDWTRPLGRSQKHMGQATCSGQRHPGG